jgi:hypothetical protein
MLASWFFEREETNSPVQRIYSACVWHRSRPCACIMYAMHLYSAQSKETELLTDRQNQMTRLSQCVRNSFYKQIHPPRGGNDTSCSSQIKLSHKLGPVSPGCCSILTTAVQAGLVSNRSNLWTCCK